MTVRASGFAPSDYGCFTAAAAQSTGISADNPVILDTTIAGNMALASNGFTLTAGRTYHLTASIGRVDFGGAGDFAIRFRDTTNNAYLGKAGYGISVAHTANISGSQHAEVIVKPTTNIVVQLWFAYANGVSSVGVDTGASAPGQVVVTVRQIQ